MKINCIISDRSTTSTIKNIDLVLRAKNTNIITIIIKDEEKQFIDITGSELYFMIKTTSSVADGSATLNKKVTEFTYPETGEAEIELSSSDTASLLGNYLYQIKIKYASKWYTLAEGNICFQKSIIERES